MLSRAINFFMEPTVTGGYTDSNRRFKRIGQAHWNRS